MSGAFQGFLRSTTAVVAPLQAGRMADFVAFLYLGELIEFNTAKQMFTKPDKKQTEDYITGRYG